MIDKAFLDSETKLPKTPARTVEGNSCIVGYKAIDNLKYSNGQRKTCELSYFSYISDFTESDIDFLTIICLRTCMGVVIFNVDS